jgi:glutathione synthase/RimK-type ligase-like ATP-grasp enzyme
MPDIVIIGSKNSQGKNDPAMIVRALHGNGQFQERTVWWEDLVFDIQQGDLRLEAAGQSLCDDATQLVLAVNWYKSGELHIYRDVAFAAGLYIDSKQVPVWNSEILHQRSTTKLSCMQQLAASSIPVPRTLFSLDPLLLYQAVVDRLRFPLIAKDAGASRGRSNHLVRSKEELRELLTAQTVNRYIVQPFMPNDHDLRVICFGGVPQLILRRARAKDSNTHLNNTSHGGEAHWLTIEEADAEMLKQCKEICRITGREMAGIDLIPDEHAPTGYACLEVNAIPQLTSGADAPRKLQQLTESLISFSKHTSV